MTPPTTSQLSSDQLHQRLGHVTIVDVRSPAEHAAGHIPGAHNIPLDQIGRAAPTLRAAAERGELVVVCASGARSAVACRQLAEAGVPAATLVGGGNAWSSGGRPLNRHAGARQVWALDRQVRFAAGVLVLLGLIVDLALPGARWFAGAIAAGLVIAAVTNTCAMGALLARLPHNRPSANAPGLDETLATLRREATSQAAQTAQAT